MKKTIFLLTFLCCLLLLSNGVNAVPYVYTYTGNYFTDITDDTPPEFTYTTSDRVTGTLTTIDGPLPDVGSSGVLDSISSYLSEWSFNDGIQTISPSTGNLGLAAGYVSGGVLLEWFLVVDAEEFFNGGLGFTERDKEIRTAWSAPFPSFLNRDRGWIRDSIDTTGDGIYDQNGFDVGEVTTAGGEWVHRPVPEPTTMLLFGAGLIGLTGFRRRFKKS